jgi:hypothetical protein
MEPQEVGGVWENVRLLAEWSPLIAILKSIVSEDDVGKQAVHVTDALEWLAAKSKNKLDDELAKKIADIVKTPQGVALLKFVVQLAEGVAK